MIKKFEIENFRSIKSLEIEDLGRINLFLGANNCAKTSILEACFLLLGFTNPQLIIRIHNFRDFGFNSVDDFRFIFKDLDYSNHVRIKANFKSPGEYRQVIVKASAVKKVVTDRNVKIDVQDISYDSNVEPNPINGKKNANTASWFSPIL